MKSRVKKKTILVFIGYYLPGYKSGGPVRTISNMLDLLGDHFNFKIITRDRDRLDNKSYENIRVNEWNDGPNCKIFYSDKNVDLKKVINEIEFDQYYLNSLFDVYFSTKVVLLWKLKLIPHKPILLAPRGELMEGALSLKSFKKRVFLFFVNLLKLYKNITWHASSEYEAQDIKRVFGAKLARPAAARKRGGIKIALDVPNYKLKTDFVRTHKKVKGKLKILFISSIIPKKNLKFAIEVLNKVEGEFIFDIFGPIKDQKYWKECLNAINAKIKNKVSYKGIIPNDQIHTVYPNYDLFFFPTLGENYGHVIYESLFYGCPVITSDKMPWDKLENFHAGRNINLGKVELFEEMIEKLLKQQYEHYKIYLNGCSKYIASFNKNVISKNNKELF